MSMCLYIHVCVCGLKTAKHALNAPPWAPLQVHMCVQIYEYVCGYICMCMWIEDRKTCLECSSLGPTAGAYVCAYMHIIIHVCMCTTYL